MAGQAVENGFDAWPRPDELIALGHQFGTAFLDGAARLGLKDTVHLLAESEQLWAGSFIITTKGILEVTMSVLQGMEDAFMMDRA
jgi:hypothetical protein